ncbi:MAG: long-chain fatty acid--CoA ligase [Nevskiaceae bacterium]|nr:MAG: long-chain fatty acid--CoA ligase [Nevskiaceae bacterium]TAM32775.1 MAG: long-chain fatty acid--CoA ligase [Nevskiaceae bacterium]
MLSAAARPPTSSPLILDLIRWRSQQTPDAPALFFAGRWYSYRALEQRANRLARRLYALGVRQGDRVGILAHNHLAHFDLLLAAPKLGYLHTAFNYRLSATELAPLLEQVQARCLFVDQACHPLLDSPATPLLSLDGYEDWLSATSCESLPPPALTTDDGHLLLFTGGSTGLPKAAVLPYRQTLGNAWRTVEAWGLDAGDCALQCTPCFHAAVNVLSLPLLACGGRVVLLPEFDAADYLAQVGRHRPSLLFMVPTMYQMLIDQPAFTGTDFSGVRWAISGGAPCPPTVRAAFSASRVRFKQGYGLTEAGVNCFGMDLDEADHKPEFVGRPLPGLEAVVRGADGRPLAPGEVGELTLRGEQVFSGYWQQPEETAQALREGWLWTGDLAQVDASGCFRIVGRRKEMYLSGGENVYPSEVEAALYRCPGVLDCAVLGLPDPLWGESGLAAVVLQAGQEADATALRQTLRTQLAAYKLPRWFQFLPALPKTGAGKIDKNEIRRRYLQAQEALPR